MPIISTIGRRSLGTRMLIGWIYLVLIAGALSMVYPMLLMISGSIKSEADFARLELLPRYLVDEHALWQRYIESKYSLIPHAEAALHRSIGSWRNLEPPVSAHHEAARLFRQFRQEFDWPVEWFLLGHAQSDRILAKNGRRFRRAAQHEFAGSIRAYNDAVGVRYPSFSAVGPPQAPFAARRFTFPQNPAYQLYYRLKADAPVADWIIVNLDGEFFTNYLAPAWGSIDEYNRAHGTSYTRYSQVLLDRRVPQNPAQRADWEDFVRNHLGLAFIRVDPSAKSAYREFLRSRLDLAELNRLFETNYASFDEVELPRGVPAVPAAQTQLSQFVRDAEACPVEALSVYGPRQAFEEFAARKHGVDLAQVSPAPLPIELLDYSDFQEQKTSLRWEFVKRNYLAVWDYVVQHGNGVRNTIIYCTLAVLTSLIVNPLAAYALSRFQPPGTYKILLFCMATMAFPAEVTMIPSFLLLRRFPLWNLVLGTLAALVVAWLLHRTRPAWPAWTKGITAGAAGIFIGYAVVPWILARGGDHTAGSISLLNTLWALVLPGMANGFSIFLLKGFFDSLPRELYEAAEIDGAGEWTKFWLLTMNLSKPILAVLALGAFTLAYSEFMMALVIIPDPSMWTLMVWLYQLQATAHPSVIYASLVFAAIPPLVVFLLCQRVIIRGIVVPIEK